MMSRLDLAAAVGEAIDPTSLMQRVCDRTMELIGAAQGVAIGLVTDQHITYVCGTGNGTAAVGTAVGINASLSGLAVTTGQILLSNDTDADPRVDAESCRRLLVASLVCIPLTRSKDVRGVMAVNSPTVNAFGDGDIEVLTRMAEFMSIAVGSAIDMYLASNQLLDLDHPDGSVGAVADQAAPTNEAAGRYVMSVIDPARVPRMDTRQRIREVLDSPDALSMVFQPIVDLISGTIVAVEALARFAPDPARAPDEWFHDAHDVGLGIELEMLAVNTALAYRGRLPADVALTINVGPEVIGSPQLKRALASDRAGNLVLELTEHTAFDRYPTLAVDLMYLRQGGVQLSVDDAGSGYSSLTHILILAPDFIKLDRQLVSGIDLDPVRRALVTALVAFGADTGARIVAEGLESMDELEALRRLGVRYAQGFYIGRPVPLDTIRFYIPIPGIAVLGSLDM